MDRLSIRPAQPPVCSRVFGAILGEEAYLRLTSWAKAQESLPVAGKRDYDMAGTPSSCGCPRVCPLCRERVPSSGSYRAEGVVTTDTRSVGPEGTGHRVAGGPGSPWHIPGS